MFIDHATKECDTKCEKQEKCNKEGWIAFKIIFAIDTPYLDERFSIWSNEPKRFFFFFFKNTTIQLWLDPYDLCHGTIDVTCNIFSLRPIGNQTYDLGSDTNYLIKRLTLGQNL